MTLSEKVQLVCDLAEDGRLSNAHYRCAVVAILYFHNTTSGECFPSLTQIAKAAHVGKATASEAMEVLRSIGVIAFVSSTGGRCKRNTYTLLNVRPTERTVRPTEPLGVRPTEPQVSRELIQERKTAKPRLRR